MKPSHNAPSAIFVAWEEIVFGSGDPARKYSSANEAIWRRLWEENIEQRLVETSVEDATLLCTLGWDFAVHQRDWKTATQRAARCAEHPDWLLADRNSRHTLMGYVAIGQLQMGQLHSALEGFRELLDLRQPRDPVPLYIVRNHLYLYTYEQPPDERAPPELVALAAEVLRDFKGCVRTAKQLNPESCAFGRLVEALVRSYPRTELSQAQDRKDEN